MRLTVLVFGAILSVVTGAAIQKWHKSEDGSQFYIENERKFTWYGSWNECARKNMSLIAIDSYAKHVQVDTLIKHIYASSPAFWIGAHDNDIAQRYEWPETGEVFSFTNWGPNQPKRGVNHCILIWTDWLWHDWPCSNLLGFICEENRYIKQKNLELEALKRECELKINGTNKFRNIVLNINPNVKNTFGNGTGPINFDLSSSRH